MQDAVKNAVFPPALSDLEIRGPIARQMDTFFTNGFFLILRKTKSMPKRKKNSVCGKMIRIL